MNKNGSRRNSTIIPCNGVRNRFANLEDDEGEDDDEDMKKDDAKENRDFKSKSVKSNNLWRPRNKCIKLEVLPKNDECSTENKQSSTKMVQE
jgi:hypothetical protein